MKKVLPASLYLFANAYRSSSDSSDSTRGSCTKSFTRFSRLASSGFSLLGASGCCCSRAPQHLPRILHLLQLLLLRLRPHFGFLLVCLLPRLTAALPPQGSPSCSKSPRHFGVRQLTHSLSATAPQWRSPHLYPDHHHQTTTLCLFETRLASATSSFQRVAVCARVPYRCLPPPSARHMCHLPSAPVASPCRSKEGPHILESFSRI